MKGMILKKLIEMIQDGELQINIVDGEVWAKVGKEQLKAGEVKSST